MSPATVALGWEELVDLRDTIAQRHVGPSASGQRLMAALLDEESESLPFPLRGLPGACTRMLIGDRYSEYLAIPPAGWTRFLLQPLPLVNRLLFNRRYYDLSGWLFARAHAQPLRQLDRGCERRRPTVVIRSATTGLARVEARTGVGHARRVVRHPVASSKRRRTLGTAFAAR